MKPLDHQMFSISYLEDRLTLDIWKAGCALSLQTGAFQRRVAYRFPAQCRGKSLARIMCSNLMATKQPHGGFDRAAFFPHSLCMANSFGHLFRITTWGESHGGGVGVVVDGCPPRLKLTEADIQPDVDQRRPGQSKIVSPRKEPDTVQILSGTFEGQPLGTPISLWVKNQDARPEAYSEMATKFRPSHADYTYFAKFGIRNWQRRR